MEENINILGKRLNELFNQYDMTQNEVATRIGITPKHLNQIISGKQLPSIETIYAISLLFHAYESVDWQKLYHKTWNQKYLEKQRDSSQVLKEFGIDYFTKIGHVKETDMELEIFSKLTRFYGSKCVYNYKDIVSKYLPFVKSKDITPETLIWFRKAELNRLNLTEIGTFRKLDFEKMIVFVLKVFSTKETTPLKEIWSKIRGYFLKRGINVINEKHIPGCQLKIVYARRGTKKSIYVSDYDEGLICNLFLILEVLYKIYYQSFDFDKSYKKLLRIYNSWSSTKSKKISDFELYVDARLETYQTGMCLCEWEK